MGWQPDPLLLDLFESVQKELADALEVLQRRRESPNDQPTAQMSAQTDKVARLSGAIEALEGALERRNSRMVH
jgi:hypothetical protein